MFCLEALRVVGAPVVRQVARVVFPGFPGLLGSVAGIAARGRFFMVSIL